jgi:hypothetical protein
MFLAPENDHATHHVLPRTPPQHHHKNTTAAHQFSQTTLKNTSKPAL